MLIFQAVKTITCHPMAMIPGAVIFATKSRLEKIISRDIFNWNTQKLIKCHFVRFVTKVLRINFLWIVTWEAHTRFSNPLPFNFKINVRKLCDTVSWGTGHVYCWKLHKRCVDIKLELQFLWSYKKTKVWCGKTFRGKTRHFTRASVSNLLEIFQN